jgi:hypothetical protein
MNGKNPAGGTSHFRARKAGGMVWDTTAAGGAGDWVSWVDANWANYKIPATSTGDGEYEAAAPTGTEWADLCITGASLAASPAVWRWEPAATGSSDGGKLDQIIKQMEVGR